MNLNNITFKALSNSDNGEVSNNTIFEYHQSGIIIWAEYSGGSIVRGNLIGKYVGENKLHFVYQHINVKNEIMTGVCDSTIEIDTEGKYVLHEKWKWTCGDFSEGTSLLKEYFSNQ